MTNNLVCFKSYDIRGQVPNELNENIATKIGFAYAKYLSPRNVVVGCDNRLTSPSIKKALIEGLLENGVNVYDIGMCGTEEIYFSTFHYNMCGGIMVTASHNPIDYNGMKLVKEDAKPISGNTGLLEIKELVHKYVKNHKKGNLQQKHILTDYIQYLTTYINHDKLKPIRLVVNAGNGAAGHVIDALEDKFQQLQLPIDFIKIHHKPDGSFPNGIPNPLLPENRDATSKAVIKHKANMGIAWDGDFDRCFLFDEKGEFIEGYYIVALLAETFLQKFPNEKIIHDPRLTWNTIDVVKKNGGTPIQSVTGHAFIKEMMRKEEAIYGGEMSAHHYFRDFSYCDSGMIPWLLVTELLSIKNKSLSSLVNSYIDSYPASGEINCKIKSPHVAMNSIEKHFNTSSINIEHIDGLSMEFNEWRFNLRCSNTEPVIRLNVESKNNISLMQKKTKEILNILNTEGNK